MNTPATYYKDLIPAGATVSKGVYGFYFRVLSAPDGCLCRLNEMGGQFPIKDTFYLRNPDAITRVEIYNPTAAAVEVEYMISQDESGDNKSSMASISGVVAVEYSRQLSEVQTRNIPQGTFSTIQSAIYPLARKYIIINEGNSNIYMGNGGLDAAGIAAGKYFTLRPWDSFEMDVKGGFKLYAPDSAAVAKIVIINSL